MVVWVAAKVVVAELARLTALAVAKVVVGEPARFLVRTLVKALAKVVAVMVVPV